MSMWILKTRDKREIISKNVRVLQHLLQLFRVHDGDDGFIYKYKKEVTTDDRVYTHRQL